MDGDDYEITFQIEDINSQKGFEYIYGFMCGKLNFSSEVNLLAQCDQEWYLVHKKYIHSKEYIFVEF